MRAVVFTSPRCPVSFSGSLGATRNCVRRSRRKLPLIGIRVCIVRPMLAPRISLQIWEVVDGSIAGPQPSRHYTIGWIGEPRVVVLDLHVEWRVGPQRQGRRADHRHRALRQRFSQGRPRDRSTRTHRRPMVHHSFCDAIEEAVGIDGLVHCLSLWPVPSRTAGPLTEKEPECPA